LLGFGPLFCHPNLRSRHLAKLRRRVQALHESLKPRGLTRTVAPA
jgi:hypothetical protein